MKKYLFMLVLLLILVGCIKNHESTSQNETIDSKLVQKISGKWQDDSYDYGDYEISVENKTIHFNSEILTITSTENNKIYTHEKKDKKSHYVFLVEDDCVIVYPSYVIEQTSDEKLVGGDLAPITLKKNPEILTTTILGKWQSTESDYPALIEINATVISNQIELIIEEAEKSTNNKTVLLTLKAKDDSSLTYLNEDKTLYYTFYNYKNKTMILGTSTTEKDVAGEGRPYNLTRLSNETDY